MNFLPNPDNIISVAAVILSVLFAYTPKLSDWYYSLDGTKKRLIMLGVLIVTVLLVFGGACMGIVTGIACDKPSAMQLVQALLIAIVLNQSTDSILPKVGARAAVTPAG